MAALPNLAKQIKHDIERREASREEWVAATKDLCAHLADARARFKADKAFHVWLVDNGLGEDVLNEKDRQAAIAMGRDIEAAALVLEKTERRSLQYIHKEEFRSAYVSGPERPRKGKPPRNPELTPAKEEAIAKDILDKGVPFKKAAAGVGSEHVAKIAVAKEQGRREERANPTVVDITLSMTAQQKLDMAIRQATHKLEVEFEQRFQVRLEKHINEVLLPIYEKRAADADRIVKARKGVMTRVQYRKIKACLHPDRAPEELKAAYTDAFNLFNELEIVLCDEKQMPTESTRMPRNFEEMMALRKRPTVKA